MKEIIIGILLFGIGLLIIKYRKGIKSMVGNFYWAESFFGNGGTYIVIILIGILLMVLGVLYPFGGLGLFLPGKPAFFEQ